MVHLQAVTHELDALQAQLRDLQHENASLRAQVETMQRRAERTQERRDEVIRGTGRMLLPLLDRYKVARTFGRLATTLSLFANPAEQWPPREKILEDSRTFLESCVRFTVRRRTMLTLFSLVAASIPFIQVWLVVKQNEIIENQAEFAEIQVYDIVARSMTEGDRNARLMSGALLSRADLDFLSGVVAEAFEQDLSIVYGVDGVNAAERRFEDAAFRGPLIRAVVGAVQLQAGHTVPSALWPTAGPMLRTVIEDAATRVPVVLRLSQRDTAPAGELDEQVDAYLVQVGSALRVYLQLAHAVGRRDDAWTALRQFLGRVSKQDLPQTRHVLAYRAAIEQLLLAVELEPELNASPTDWAARDLEPSAAMLAALRTLESELGSEGISWDGLKRQLELR